LKERRKGKTERSIPLQKIIHNGGNLQSEGEVVSKILISIRGGERMRGKEPRRTALKTKEGVRHRIESTRSRTGTVRRGGRDTRCAGVIGLGVPVGRRH